MYESSTATIPDFKRAAAVARYTTVFLLFTMFLGTHLPSSIALPMSLSFTHADLLLHASAYLMLAFSALTSWELTIGLLQPQHYFTVWLLGTLYGAFDEVTQIPVGRVCNVADWLSDILGLVVGLILFRITRPLLYRFLSKKHLSAQ
ncbi:MAG: VanZ family protein [Pirellulales bacterium]|nr:VanZ family protein [Pirellulales bacterium]